MGKETELWDDSALVQAFDDAMSKYKKMHSKKKPNDNSMDEEKIISNREVNDSVCDNLNYEAEGVREAEDTYNVVSNNEAEMREVKNPTSVEEESGVHTHVAEPYIDSSNDLATQDAAKCYSYSQGAEDYNRLLSQYYELEDKKQLILQQLHQFSSWNYQFSGEGSGSGAQWGACTTSQEHAVSASQAPHPTVVCSCCSYGSQSLVTPCTAYPTCSLGGTCTGITCTDTNALMTSQKPSSLVNADIVKTAMGAVEKAISSMKMKPSANPDINEDAEEKKENEEEIAQCVSSETDLTVVLNAWYSAGFYTGKYLTEQSLGKNRPG